MIYGPWGCANCGWSENPAYDCREGIRRDGHDRVFDQYGMSHHVDRPGGQAVLAELNVQDRGAKKAFSEEERVTADMALGMLRELHRNYVQTCGARFRDAPFRASAAPGWIYDPTTDTVREQPA